VSIVLAIGVSYGMTIDKQQIAETLAKHNVRTACTLVDLAVLVMDLLDVQSSTVIEAIIDEAKRRHVTGPNASPERVARS
jgi:hypothetical protein